MYIVEQLEWEKAANQLRQPYWGWDNTQTMVPPEQIIAMPTVEIVKPNGAREHVPNPFFAYKFPPGSTALFDPPYRNWSLTARHPDPSGRSNVDELRASLRAIAQQTSDNTSRLFRLCIWEEFSSRLESIHDSIHIHTGGSGHMSSAAVTGFDPIFYLHHSQVDRVTDQWYRRHGRWVSDHDDLKPFWKSESTYWSSPTIRDTSTFNYEYDPIMPESLQADEVLEWSARIRCKQFELGGSFSVFLFLGKIPADPKGWLSDDAFAGTFDVFTNSAPEECANCSEQTDQVISGYVYLNNAILRLSDGVSLEPNVVEPYLRNVLNWGIKKANGGLARIEELSSLEVTVLATPLIMPVGAEIPDEGEPQYYHDITCGRPGGYDDN